MFTTTFNRAHFYLGSREIEFYWPLNFKSRGGGLNIFVALPENLLPLEIFISRHWFYLNTGTIDLLCIIILIMTVGAWDFLSQKKIITTTPWLPWNCLKIITEENTDFLFIISCCLNALDPKYNTFLQGCGAVVFWCGSGSLEPYKKIWLRLRLLGSV